MEPDKIKQIVEELGTGNNSLLLLLKWSARVQSTQFKSIPDEESGTVAGLLLEKVNDTCNTSIRRVDLQAGGDRYWSGPGKKYIKNLENEARILKSRLILRASARV